MNHALPSLPSRLCTLPSHTAPGLTKVLNVPSASSALRFFLPSSSSSIRGGRIGGVGPASVPLLLRAQAFHRNGRRRRVGGVAHRRHGVRRLELDGERRRRRLPEALLDGRQADVCPRRFPGRYDSGPIVVGRRRRRGRRRPGGQDDAGGVGRDPLLARSSCPRSSALTSYASNGSGVRDDLAWTDRPALLRFSMRQQHHSGYGPISDERIMCEKSDGLE